MPHTAAVLETVPQALLVWADAVKSGDIDVIVSLYAPHAKLKGTVWDGFVGLVPDKMEERNVYGYFKNLKMGRENIRVRWNSIFEVKNGVWAVDYSFVFNDEKTGEEQVLNADATFIFDEEEGKIILHHSSPARNA